MSLFFRTKAMLFEHCTVTGSWATSCLNSKDCCLISFHWICMCLMYSFIAGEPWSKLKHQKQSTGFPIVAEALIPANHDWQSNYLTIAPPQFPIFTEKNLKNTSGYKTNIKFYLFNIEWNSSHTAGSGRKFGIRFCGSYLEI